MTLSVFFVALAQIAYYIALFAFVPLGIIFRFLITRKSVLSNKLKALVIFNFTSFSFFYFLEQKSKGEKLYRIFLLVFFGVALLSLISGLHIYF